MDCGCSPGRVGRGVPGWAQGEGDDEWPRDLDPGGQALGQAEDAAALGFDDEPAEQGNGHGGHGGSCECSKISGRGDPRRPVKAGQTAMVTSPSEVQARCCGVESATGSGDAAQFGQSYSVQGGLRVSGGVLGHRSAQSPPRAARDGRNRQPAIRRVADPGDRRPFHPCGSWPCRVSFPGVLSLPLSRVARQEAEVSAEDILDRLGPAYDDRFGFPHEHGGGTSYGVEIADAVPANRRGRGGRLTTVVAAVMIEDHPGCR